MSVPVPKPGASFESSWKRVDVDFKSMIALYDVDSDAEVAAQVVFAVC